MLKKILSYAISSVILLSGVIIPVKIVSAVTATDITLKYKAHVQNIGWSNDYSVNGKLAGTTGRNLRLEALQFELKSSIPDVKVLVQTHIQDVGWSNDWIDSSKLAGSVGKSRRLEAIRIKLVGAPSNYHVQYQAHVQDIGWQPWVEDGGTSGTTGQSKKIEAIKINIVSSPNSGISNGDKKVDIKYDSHVQDIGWTPYMRNGEITGTTGQSKKIEGLRISLVNAPINMKVKYQAYIQNSGWQDWKGNGQYVGTVGKNLRVEALKIILENAPAGYYVQYQAHIENLGWQNWVEDGDIVGKAGGGLRIEALRIVLSKSSLPNTEETKYTSVNTTFDNFLNNHNQEVYLDENNRSTTAPRSIVEVYSNPVKLQTAEKKYQFLRIDTNRQLQSVEQVNAALVGMGIFEGKAQAFLNVAKEFNIDPIYLISHAMWETGRGKSTLAKGVIVKEYNGQPVQETVVYNFFGIGAIDDNAIGAGAATAYYYGWTTPEKAIRGGAEWINKNYIRRSGFPQPSVYFMRWDTKSFWHEYATDVNWANGIAGFMKQFSTLYKGQKLTFEIPVYQK